MIDYEIDAIEDAEAGLVTSQREVLRVLRSGKVRTPATTTEIAKLTNSSAPAALMRLLTLQTRGLVVRTQVKGRKGQTTFCWEAV